GLEAGAEAPFDMGIVPDVDVVVEDVDRFEPHHSAQQRLHGGTRLRGRVRAPAMVRRWTAIGPATVARRICNACSSAPRPIRQEASARSSSKAEPCSSVWCKASRRIVMAVQ